MHIRAIDGVRNRALGERRERSDLLAAILVPFIHLSVYLFRTLHPRPIVLKPSAPSLPGSMLTTLLISFCAFVLLFIGLLRMRYRWATERDELLVAEGVE